MNVDDMRHVNKCQQHIGFLAWRAPDRPLRYLSFWSKAWGRWKRRPSSGRRQADETHDPGNLVTQR